MKMPISILCGAVALVLFAGTPARAAYPDPGGDWPREVLPQMNGSPGDFAPRRAGVEVQADIRIGISASGVYRVTQPQLVALGLSPAALVGDRLRLFCRTQEVAVTVSTSALFGAGDFLQFYGAGHDGIYSPTNVFWLGLGTNGLRMSQYNASTNAGGTLVTTHVDRARYAPDLLYRAFYRPLDDAFDHWFAALLMNSAAAATTVTTDERVTNGTATIVAAFYGLTSEAVNPDHTTRVSVNGTVVQDVPYDGEQNVSSTSTFAASLLLNGATPVSFLQVAPGAANDRAYLQEYYIDYTRLLKARAGQLVFWGPAGTSIYSVSGLTTNAGIVVLDITDPAAPVSLTNWSVSGSPGNYTLWFRHVTASAHRYILAAPQRIVSAPDIRRAFFRGLSATGQQADYIAVCPYPFRSAGYQLLKYRATNGMHVAVAPPEDIYNEFSYGIVDAAAIKQFFGYAFHHWSNPPPKYACLMGDGTYDPKNNLGLNPPLTIPVKYGPAPFARSPHDGWFATVNGADLLPDISIGRIPVSSLPELQLVVNKIVAFESMAQTKNAILVADNVDGAMNFKTSTQAIILPALVPAGYSLSQQYLDDTATATIRLNIRNGIIGGCHLVTFFGHGAANLWCAENVWNTTDVYQLTNVRTPIVTVFSCENGSFDDPAVESLAEAFLKRSGGGAVACVAPVSLSVHIYSEKIATGFFAEFPNTSTRLGDSMNSGLLRLWQFNASASELTTYVLIGDPATEKY